MTAQRDVEHLLRELAPQVLGTLARRHARFDACEDAVQEALLAAATRWPAEGVPDNPRTWLIAVARRRLIDEVRSEQARRRREETVARLAASDQPSVPGPDEVSRLRTTTPSRCSSSAVIPCSRSPRRSRSPCEPWAA